MVIRTSYALACTGLLAVAGTGCAGMQQKPQSSDPTAMQVRESQGQSEQALKSAHEAQKKASEQQQRATEAQQDVQKLQQQLAQAQQKARQEQAKAQQAQQEANSLTQQSAQQAQRSQEQASRGLSQANEKAARGQQSTRGLVTQAGPDQLVVRQQSGEPMTFTVTDQTNVRIDGERASLGDLQQGQDALVSYEVGGVQPRALSVQVVTGKPEASPQGTGSGSGTGSSQGSGSSYPSGSSPSGTSPPQGSDSSYPSGSPSTGGTTK